jgi:hypothetical protein
MSEIQTISAEINRLEWRNLHGQFEAVGLLPNDHVIYQVFHENDYFVGVRKFDEITCGCASWLLGPFDLASEAMDAAQADFASRTLAQSNT